MRSPPSQTGATAKFCVDEVVDEVQDEVGLKNGCNQLLGVVLA